MKILSLINNRHLASISTKLDHWVQGWGQIPTGHSQILVVDGVA